MEVKVIHSCDDNPYYLDFWKPISKIWKEVFNITPVLIHVGRKQVEDEYGEVHTIAPDESLPIHTQAQLARLWYPMKEPDVLWITSDIDMFPASKRWWKDVINYYMENKPTWTNLNASIQEEYSGVYYPICYNIALGKDFKKILKVEDSFYDFVNRGIQETEVDNKHTPENWDGSELTKWNVDEVMVTKKVRDSGVDTHLPLKDRHRRINRKECIKYGDNNEIVRFNYFDYIIEDLKNGWYHDCHSIRPYHSYKEEIEKVLSIVGEQV